MFLIDSNVLSALMSARPVPEIATWFSGQSAEQLFTASVCQAEILSGLAIMPKGRRSPELEVAARAMFLDDFEGRVLPFDIAAANADAAIFAARRSAGGPTTTIDIMIAAIGSSLGFGVVTRNVTDFDGTGVIVINPWNAPNP